MRDEIDRSDWLENGSQDLNCQGVEGGGPLVAYQWHRNVYTAA